MLEDNGRRVIGFPAFDGTAAGRIATSTGIQQELQKGYLIHIVSSCLPVSLDTLLVGV